MGIIHGHIVQLDGCYFVYIIEVPKVVGFVWTEKTLFCKFHYSRTDTYMNTSIHETEVFRCLILCFNCA